MKLKIEYVDINSIKPYENNAKLHPEEQIEQIKKSIEQFGMDDPIGIWKDEIVEGHGRLIACKQLGYKEVPIIRLDHLTDEERKAYTLAHNKLTMNSDFDIDLLNEELDNFDTIDMSDFGFDIDLDLNEEQEIVEDEVPDVPDEPKAKLGDIYQLGNHRLMCGDSTSEEDVAKLMNGVKADMVFTDPPYGVNIKGKYTGTILNDDLQKKELEEFLIKINSNINKFNKGNVYICYEVLNSIEFFNAFGRPSEVICINKSSASFYNKNKYNRKFELILFYENQKPIYGLKETNVWDTIKSSQINSYDENGKRFDEEGSFCCVHPTAKPISVPTNAIKNSSKEEEVILDLFGGSGSTLIACEQLNRKCYMMELDPHYIDVIIQRWENFTGKKAIKL